MENIQRIATSTQTQIQFLDQGPCLVISGAVACVLAARKEMTGLMPVTVQFEKSPHVQPSKSLLRALEAELNVQISEKKKPAAGGAENVSMLLENSIVIVSLLGSHYSYVRS